MAIMSLWATTPGGWRYEFPATKALGIYGPNHDTQAATVASVFRFAPTTASTSDGGGIEFLGAGFNSSFTIDNLSGNARIAGIPAGKALQVVAADGTAVLSGKGFELSNNFKVGRGGGGRSAFRRRWVSGAGIGNVGREQRRHRAQRAECADKRQFIRGRRGERWLERGWRERQHVHWSLRRRVADGSEQHRDRGKCLLRRSPGGNERHCDRQRRDCLRKQRSPAW